MCRLGAIIFKKVKTFDKIKTLNCFLIENKVLKFLNLKKYIDLNPELIMPYLKISSYDNSPPPPIYNKNILGAPSFKKKKSKLAIESLTTAILNHLYVILSDALTWLIRNW